MILLWMIMNENIEYWIIYLNYEWIIDDINKHEWTSTAILNKSFFYVSMNMNMTWMNVNEYQSYWINVNYFKLKWIPIV